MTRSRQRGVRGGRGGPVLRALLLSVSAMGVATCVFGTSGAVAAESPAPWAPALPGAAVGPGAWQKHEYSFAFMGFTTTYSCDGLADKLKLLLLAAGARPDAKARAGACGSGFGRPDKFARADLTFYTLTPAGGDSAPGGGASGGGASGGAVADAPGRWTPVTLGVSKPRDLARGDCELVEQFRSQVLPMFTTRNVENHTTCVPHQLSGSSLALTFDSFSAPSASAAHQGPSPRGD